ncbi:MAG: glutathione S-transferase family protein [Rhodospirillales bacterium]|nr:glutathione S-transferase family protein [Rhodospirillales bacterium]
MIEVHSWTTGNARKVYIMLEECGLEFRINPIVLARGEQFSPEFLAISPNNKIPAIIDLDGPGGQPYSVFESGAILMYLAHKTGKFLSDDPRQRSITIQWLMFQMGDLGPMFGQAGHFVSRRDQPGMKAGFDHYVEDAKRLMGVLELRLADNDFVAGKDFSIADIAIFPWCQQPEKPNLDFADYPNFKRWFDQMAERPSVIRAAEICEDVRESVGMER